MTGCRTVNYRTQQFSKTTRTQVNAQYFYKIYIIQMLLCLRLIDRSTHRACPSLSYGNRVPLGLACVVEEHASRQATFSKNKEIDDFCRLHASDCSG